MSISAFQNEHSGGGIGLSGNSSEEPLGNGSSPITFRVVNNFAAGTQYYSSNYGNDQVWLYFLNADNFVTYVDSTTNLTVTVTDAQSISLNSVKNGEFFLADGCDSTKVFAALGASSPFSGVNGPGIFDTNIPYALTEWTITGTVYDNIDVSYQDTLAFPTTLTVRTGTGIVTNQSTFRAGTTSESLINMLKSTMSTTPIGPSGSEPGGDNYPVEGADAGWGPLVPTVSGDDNAMRWIGSSKYWISGVGPSDDRGIYYYSSSLEDYLKYLHDNETVQFPEKNNISGWYIDYSGNGGYSFYLSVKTDIDGNYYLHIHDVRYDVGGSDVPAPPWTADPSAWTSVTGDITIAANGAASAMDGKNVFGNWTDITIFSGASLINGDFSSGPVITGTGDLGTGGAYAATLNPTIIASICASMATGLLGNSFYVDGINGNLGGTDGPVSTMYWFNELERGEYRSFLFESGWGDGQEFYDPYCKMVAEATNMQGYLSPFNDRWSNFSPNFSLTSDSVITWSLGISDSAREPANDFNGDGCSDVLLKSTNGSLGSWHDAYTGSWTNLGVLPAGWDIAGIGDMNNTGMSDIVLINSDNYIGMWKGGYSSCWTGFGSIGSDWSVAGVADFTDNGYSDLLLRHDDGYLGYWESGTTWVGIGALSTDWTVAGTGDFNGNGKADIVLRHNTGTVGMWLDANPSTWMSAGTLTEQWEISGIGDFDNNGKSDLLLFDDDSGTLGLWMDGSSANWQSVGTLPAGWSLAGIGDFNADGDDDLLLTEPQGSLGMWLSADSSNWLSVGNYNPGTWTVANSCGV